MFYVAKLLWSELFFTFLWSLSQNFDTDTDSLFHENLKFVLL